MNLLGILIQFFFECLATAKCQHHISLFYSEYYVLELIFFPLKWFDVIRYNASEMSNLLKRIVKLSVCV